MRKLTVFIHWVVALSLLLTASISLVAASSAPALPKGIMKLDGRAALPLVLKDIDGEQWDISESAGRWVFVHFWASWCGPCREEMPTIQAIVSQFDQQELEIVLINTAESEDMIFEFIAAVAPDLNSLIDADGQVTERWQPRGLPATYFVDPAGKLQYLALGGRAWNEPVYMNFLKSLNDSDN